jgi:hypothetical protein
MFEKLLVQTGIKPANKGFIWSLEGDHYLAFQKDADGNLVKQAEHAFRSLVEAKAWLHSDGVKDITMEQSNAYFEMVGQDHTKDELQGHNPLITH